MSTALSSGRNFEKYCGERGRPFVAKNHSSLGLFALNLMQYIAYFMPTNAFIVEELLLQLCYNVIQLLFNGFQKLPGRGAMQMLRFGCIGQRLNIGQGVKLHFWT
jgi:hypothetical protein